jgi:AraC family transcriptional regulator, positive regulator of tynA and feaB
MVLMWRHSWTCDAAPHPTAETMMGQTDDILDTPQLDYETWRVVLRSLSGRYNPEGIEPSVFAGWVRPVSVCGFTALDIGANAQRIERTGRDVRLDGMEQYSAVFQVAGRSAISQNDQVASLAFGDVALIDASRPDEHLRQEAPKSILPAIRASEV